jgi:nucleotide-binding universal stress UspA family protein
MSDRPAQEEEENPQAHLTFASILVGYDGSENSKKSVDAARLLAKKNGSKLTIVSVIEPPVYFVQGEVGTPLADLSEYFEEARRKAETQIRTLVAEAQSDGIDASGKVLARDDASTAKAVIEYATTNGVDLIVVGTRGLGGFKKLFLGSVSGELITHARCSVLVVR